MGTRTTFWWKHALMRTKDREFLWKHALVLDKRTFLRGQMTQQLNKSTLLSWQWTQHFNKTTFSRGHWLQHFNEITLIISQACQKHLPWRRTVRYWRTPTWSGRWEPSTSVRTSRRIQVRYWACFPQKTLMPVDYMRIFWRWYWNYIIPTKVFMFWKYYNKWNVSWIE